MEEGIVDLNVGVSKSEPAVEKLLQRDVGGNSGILV
jgi:hypothetical protein